MGCESYRGRRSTTLPATRQPKGTSTGEETCCISTGAEIASATTDGNGNYIFSNDTNGTSTGSHIYNLTSLDPNIEYVVRIENVMGGSKQGALGVNNLTTANTGEGTNTDINDSDGVTASNDADATILATDIPLLGANNHTFDFGFSPAPPSCSLVITIADSRDGNSLCFVSKS